LDAPLLLDQRAPGLLLLAQGLGGAAALLGLAAGEGDAGEEELVLGGGQVDAAAGPGDRVLEGGAAEEPVVELAGGEPALDRLGEAVLLLLALEPAEVIDLGEDQVAGAEQWLGPARVLAGEAHQPELGLDRRVGIGLHPLAG